MKKLIINDDNLAVQEIDFYEIRVKCFVVNDENKIMLASTRDGCYQLPGGHVEESEKFNDAVKREILEETGIELNDEEIIKIFYERHILNKNYKNSGKNKQTSVIYYLIKTNKKINLNKTNMTQEEKDADYSIDLLSLETMEEKLIDNLNNNPVEIFRIVSEETLNALCEFKRLKLLKI